MLSPEAKARLTRAVEEAEGKAGIEVVVVGFQRAVDYLDAAFRNALSAALVTLALVLLLPVEVHHDLVFPLVAAAAVGAFFLTRVPAVLRLTTTRARRELAIETAVARAFLARGVHKTRERVGMLVTWFDVEQSVRVVFDSGLEKEIPKDVRDRLVVALTSACLDDAQRPVAITALGEQVAPYVPHDATRANELDNAPTAGAGAAA
jgi:putative membrane protein